jgi:hypothetical protein
MDPNFFQKYTNFLQVKHRHSSRRIASVRLKKAFGDFSPAGNCNWSKTLENVPATPGSGFSCLADQLEFYTFQQRNILSDSIVRMLFRKLLGKGVIKRMLRGGTEGRKAGMEVINLLKKDARFLNSLKNSLNQAVLKDRSRDSYLNALRFLIRDKHKPYVYQWIQSLPLKYKGEGSKVYSDTVKKLVSASLFNLSEMGEVLSKIFLDEKIYKALALSFKYLNKEAVARDKEMISENNDLIGEMKDFVQTVFDKNWHNSHLKQEILYRLYSSGVSGSNLKKEIVREIGAYLSDNRNSRDPVFKGVKTYLKDRNTRRELNKAVAKYVSEFGLDSLSMKEVVGLGGGIDFDLGEEQSGYSEDNF